jgi:hypothetical protein
VAFIGYLAWNAFHLARGRVPPSIFFSVTGLPAPSTGATRALLALSEGRFVDSLLWNPLLGAYLALFAASAWYLVSNYLRLRRLLLPGWLAAAWFGSLLLGWILKFILGPRYW